MKNTSFLLLLVLVLLVSSGVIPVWPVAASCYPSGDNTGEVYQNCPLLRKTASWHIYWPCSLSPQHDADLEVVGSGVCSLGNQCCTTTMSDVPCWPAFNQPVVSNGLWRISINNKTTNVAQTACGSGCGTATTVTCVTSSTVAFESDHSTNCNHDECVLQQCEAGCAYDCDSGYCVGSGCSSPVLIDVAGDGFSLTDPAGGVQFDLNTDGVKENLAWTTTDSDDSWLVLDRNGNGTVDNGAELFGDHTPQSSTALKNGFLALSEYDKANNGGNGDGTITSSDAVYSSLRLWNDSNHNGVSEPSELQRLSDSNIQALGLDYKTSRRTDEYGNRFRYRAKIKDAQGVQLGRWAWDVFLVNP